MPLHSSFQPRVAVWIAMAALVGFPNVGIPAEPASEAVASVLRKQVSDWNRGDLPAFVQSYAPRCTLVGSDISERTREQVLAHYQEKYPSKAVRGVLTFSGLRIYVLDEQSAAAAGHWHVQRDKISGGAVGGVFSVVLKRNHGVWQIVLDHTS